METRSSTHGTEGTEGAPKPAPLSDKYLARDWHNARALFDRDYLTGLIVTSNGNASEAARRACMDRSSFYRKMRKLNMHLKDICANYGLPYCDPTPCLHTSKRPAPVLLPPPPTGFEYYQGQLKRVLKPHDSTCQSR